jgi:hypothetical protein
LQLYKIQPAPRTDHITDDGTELTQRPYPIVVDASGNAAENQALNVARVVGFVRDLARMEVDFSWHEVAAGHIAMADVVGMYVIIQNREGAWSTLMTAVESFVKLPTGPDLRADLRKPPPRVGVHVTHCCALHGCKYGDADCPVKLGQVAQEYPCEQCPEEPATPADEASADELLHHLRECVSALEEPLHGLATVAPVLATQLAAMRRSMDELDRKLTHGHPLPGDWNARR